MLRPLRRKLRLIRYYSASREETVWSRAADWILIASFLLALPTVMIGDISVIRTGVAVAQPGVLSRDVERERILAAIQTEDEPSHVWTPGDIGRFTIRIVEEQRGWPLITSTRNRPAEVEYDLYREQDRRLDRGRTEDAPMREAIAEALERRGRVDLLASWQSMTPTHQSKPVLSWLFASVMWWVMLYAIGMIALLISRVGFAAYQHHHGRRARALRRSGLCEHCGYDLRGTAYSDRCPECGEYST